VLLELVSVERTPELLLEGDSMRESRPAADLEPAVALLRARPRPRPAASRSGTRVDVRCDDRAEIGRPAKGLSRGALPSRPFARWLIRTELGVAGADDVVDVQRDEEVEARVG
jgi:hypothetical protein